MDGTEPDCACQSCGSGQRVWCDDDGDGQLACVNDTGPGDGAYATCD